VLSVPARTMNDGHRQRDLLVKGCRRRGSRRYGSEPRCAVFRQGTTRAQLCGQICATRANTASPHSWSHTCPGCRASQIVPASIRAPPVRAGPCRDRQVVPGRPSLTLRKALSPLPDQGRGALRSEPPHGTPRATDVKPPLGGRSLAVSAGRCCCEVSRWPAGRRAGAPAGTTPVPLPACRPPRQPLYRPGHRALPGCSALRVGRARPSCTPPEDMLKSSPSSFAHGG
jgi:hypothetical protein